MIRQENRERPIFADTLGFLATVPQKSQIDELRSRLARSDASDQELYRWLQGGNLEAVVKAVRLEGETERETLNWMLKMGTETITIPDENNLQAKVRAEARAAV